MNTTKSPKKVSDLTSLFEEKNSEVIAQPRAVNVVSPSKKPAATSKAGGTASARPSPKPRLSRNDLSGTKATKSHIPSRTSNASSTSSSSSSNTQLFTDFKAPSKISEGCNSQSSGKVSRTILSYESPCERSLYLHGRKKMLSVSDITGSDRSLESREVLPGRNEGYPLEHTSSAENLFFSQKSNMKHLILERLQNLEDTRKSPVHNDLKECELIMKRFADAKMRDLRNKFEKSVDDSGIGGAHHFVKTSSANIRGTTAASTATLPLRGDFKPSNLFSSSESFKTRASTLGSTKTSYLEFLNSTQDKNISSLQNIKFDIDSSCKITVSERTTSSSAGTTYKSQTAENILQKKKLANILKNAANDVRLPSRVQPLNKSPSSSSSCSSSSSSSSSEPATDGSFSGRKKRGSYENVIQSGQVKFLTSKIRGGSTNVDSGKCTDTNGVNNGCEDSSDIYDDIANTVDARKSLEIFKARKNIQKNSCTRKEPQMNGRNSSNSKSTSALVKHISRVDDDDDDDDDDFYESIDVPLKSATISGCMSWIPAQDSSHDSSSSESSGDEKVKSVLKRKNAIKNKRYSSCSLQNINRVNPINFPSDSVMKKGNVSETPPPIPPRDKIPEAPPLPPRKQEETLSLKTVVPLPIPSPKNNRNSSSQDSSSNDSLQGSKTKPGGETENRKLSRQLSEDYVCMSSPTILINSSENNLADLNIPDYDEDNLYGVNIERYNSCFGMEPLYQFCGTDIKKQKKGVNRNSHIYCEIGSLNTGNSESKVSSTTTSESQGSESLGSEFLRANSQRTLWHEMPQVKNSGLLKTISDSERKCQEAIFEVITSEASYLKSLNILMTTFLLSPEFSDKSGKSILSRQERHEMFSNIGAVRETSEKFLADLEERWKKSTQIHDICDIITDHVQKNTFNVYIRYCTNMTYQERMYNKLLKRPEFEAALKSIEKKDACQRLPMKTFLLLPMQRITRIPLLIDSVRHRLDPNTDRYRSADTALQAINKIVKQCNEGARQMESMEELIALQKQMQFKVKEFPLISASRMLVKKGEAIEIVSEPPSKTIFKRTKPTKNSIYLFLFNDLLLITKKRGNHYDVVDYCSRAFLDPQRIRDPDKCKLLPHGVPPNVRFLILLVMLENFENKRMEMILAFNSENDCERWLTAVTPVTVEGNERIYSAWDCPEVEAICSYKAYEKDELSLEANDVVTVFRKLNDGWYYGERSHDGETGWFPSEVTKEIVGEHCRARNMRLKYQVEGNIEVE